jgi:hypothetical protein
MHIKRYIPSFSNNNPYTTSTCTPRSNKIYCRWGRRRETNQFSSVQFSSVHLQQKILYNFTTHIPFSFFNAL